MIDPIRYHEIAPGFSFSRSTNVRDRITGTKRITRTYTVTEVDWIHDEVKCLCSPPLVGGARCSLRHRVVLRADRVSTPRTDLDKKARV